MGLTPTEIENIRALGKMASLGATRDELAAAARLVILDNVRADLDKLDAGDTLRKRAPASAPTAADADALAKTIALDAVSNAADMTQTERNAICKAWISERRAAPAHRVEYFGKASPSSNGQRVADHTVNLDAIIRDRLEQAAQHISALPPMERLREVARITDEVKAQRISVDEARKPINAARQRAGQITS